MGREGVHLQRDRVEDGDDRRYRHKYRDRHRRTVRPRGRRLGPARPVTTSTSVNRVLVYRYDIDLEGPVDAKPTKQPVAPYRSGDAEPVLWNTGLGGEHPAADLATVEP